MKTKNDSNLPVFSLALSVAAISILVSMIPWISVVDSARQAIWLYTPEFRKIVYVDQGRGNDQTAKPQSRLHPFKTISAACDAAKRAKWNHGSLSVAPGSYSFWKKIPVARSDGFNGFEVRAGSAAVLALNFSR